MPKRKREENDEIESLQKEVRELKALNRSLIKQIKKLNKGANRIESLEELLQDELAGKVEHGTKEVKRKGNCPECDEGQLEILDLGSKTYQICSHCAYRKKEKKA